MHNCLFNQCDCRHYILLPMKVYYKLILIIFIAVSVNHAMVKTVVSESSPETLKLILTNTVDSPGDLVPVFINIGLPNSDLPETIVEYLDETPFPFSSTDLPSVGVKWTGSQLHQGLHTGTLEVSPFTNQNTFFKKILITINFPEIQRTTNGFTSTQEKLLSAKIINWKTASAWVNKTMKKMFKKAIPSGTWFKFAIKKDGIYKITGETLINSASVFSSVNPKSLMIFTNDKMGRAQNYTTNQPVPENLKEIAIQVVGEENDVLNNDDILIFYANGPSGYNTTGTSVQYSNNVYFSENIYWLLIPEDNTSSGKRISTPAVNPGDLTISTGFRQIHFETDQINPFESGLAWVGESIFNQSSYAIDLNIGSASPSGDATLKYRLLGASSSTETTTSVKHTVSIHMGSTQNDALTTLTWYGSSFKTGSVTIPESELTGAQIRIFFKNIASNTKSEPYIDNIDLHFESELEFQDSSLVFYPPSSVGGYVKIKISSDVPLAVWNVQDPLQPIGQDTAFANDKVSFPTALSIDTLAQFIVFNPAEIKQAGELVPMGNINFSTFRNTSTSASHIILGPEEFRSSAQPLIEHRGNSIYVDLETIYREFSGGNKDPLAIRNFIQWTQENWQDPVPYAIFILGDADYDYRNITGESKTIVPTIEIGTTSSYASDDFLATIYGAIPEIAIGRLPAKSVEDVVNYIEKLIQFESNPELGLWRQKITLVADDAARPEPRYGSIYVGKSHTRNSEALANLIPDKVSVKKFYLLEYPEVSDASSYGVIKPAATQDLFSLLKSGTAIINYIGHGSEHQWAQEKLLVQDRDLLTIDTGMKLPIWIAGTCSWGHFDAIKSSSFAEEIILLPFNGASAIITTTRAISVSGNAQYEIDLFESFFPGGNVSKQPIGVLLQSIKTPYRESKYFQLFGDPAMPFTIPAETISIDQITPDTLGTLEIAEFTGTQDISTSGGIGYVIIQDADKNITREYNIASDVESVSYILPGRELFRGKITVDDNDFSGSVRIPKDISYSSDPGFIKMYFITSDDPPQEALGIKSNIHFKGGNYVEDNMGPIISLETESGRILRSGDHVFQSENLFIRLQDPLGINTADEIGHEISLTNMENGTQQSITEFFTYDANSIISGTIPLQLDDNSNQIHLKIKAWDSGNNPNENEFVISREAKQNLKVFQIYNFPNPFESETTFQFEITRSAEISIDIFTTNGRKIYSHLPQTFQTGTHNIVWNGLDKYGDEIANGVYLYRLKAKGEDNSVSQIGRIAKFR